VTGQLEREGLRSLVFWTTRGPQVCFRRSGPRLGLWTAFAGPVLQPILRRVGLDGRHGALGRARSSSSGGVAFTLAAGDPATVRSDRYYLGYWTARVPRRSSLSSDRCLCGSWGSRARRRSNAGAADSSDPGSGPGPGENGQLPQHDARPDGGRRRAGRPAEAPPRCDSGSPGSSDSGLHRHAEFWCSFQTRARCLGRTRIRIGPVQKTLGIRAPPGQISAARKRVKRSDRWRAMPWTGRSTVARSQQTERRTDSSSRATAATGR
jgi:hypothetical protein